MTVLLKHSRHRLGGAGCKQMPKSQIGIAATDRNVFLKSQSASEIATKIASKSVKKRVDITTEITMIRITAIPNR